MTKLDYMIQQAEKYYVNNVDGSDAHRNVYSTPNYDISMKGAIVHIVVPHVELGAQLYGGLRAEGYMPVPVRTRPGFSVSERGAEIWLNKPYALQVEELEEIFKVIRSREFD